MDQSLTRRSLIGAGLAMPLLGLAACVGGPLGLDHAAAIRRLLTLSSQRAFARLLAENGFFETEVARVTLPPELGGNGPTSLLAALIRTETVQRRLLQQVNRAAETAADAAAPIVLQSIRGLRFTDAVAIVRGGSSAATDYLQRSMGRAIFDAMLPGVGSGLRLFDSAILQEALRAATGIDFAELQHDVTLKASEGIYRAIAREEAAIRDDPSATGDPLLEAAFGLLGSG